ncbi:hypothetical protein SAMN04488120_101244 [Fontimonas thermophila]|uniref:Uncharacterized protein n=1 Tax=Fontimonas thermophila TaxID=1076937 RepID=A0A1I2H8Y3_9GAMM|nr:hypothetical protein [Fontimonas thermophila]SFF26122.1 hypothetical protein SAMN04488120_101244 [Fontimonas thermophila]
MIRSLRWLIAGSCLWNTGVAAQSPLDADMLAHCAAQVRHLRSAAPRLLEQDAQLSAQREQLLERQRALASETTGSDLHAHLAREAQRRELDAAIREHNARVEQLRADIAALNTVWKDYDAHCAGRPYRRSDFERLPPEAQAAMRAGLADVQVPYVPALMTPPASISER